VHYVIQKFNKIFKKFDLKKCEKNSDIYRMSEFEFPETFPENFDMDQKEEEKLMLILKQRQKEPEMTSLPKPGEIKISVKTSNGVINKKTHIPLLCEKINYILANKNKVTSTGKRKFLGSRIIKIIKTSENFYNSVEIIMKIREDKNINLKYFKNGKITCTGCKEDNDGLDAINYLIKEIKDYDDIFVKEEGEEETELQLISYKISNINANFSIKFLIDNHRLYSFLLKNREKYSLFIDYAPDSYQGVKICFLWNENQPVKNGICCCQKKCKYSAKKKGGKGEGDCRRISLAVFSTGCILLAGAQTTTQLNDAYQFIVKILQENYGKIVQYTIGEQDKIKENPIKRKDGVLLKKLKIKI
jgi:TATA-box binding protein (TBP) (component of TFIID and TFIIIB)